VNEVRKSLQWHCAAVKQPRNRVCKMVINCSMVQLAEAEEDYDLKVATMSLRSQKSRVTFSAEDGIEMDSLEPEVNSLFGRNDMLSTIKEYEYCSENMLIDSDFDDVEDIFEEFDVS